MLVLTRKIKEDVIITLPDGQQIVVRLLDFRKNGQASIGFEAPKSINIARREVLDERNLPITGS